MNKLIKKFLDDNYKVIGCAIFPFEYSDDTYWLLIRQEELANKLSVIFGLSQKQLKWYIKGWLLSKNKNFPFNTWWKERNSVTVATSTHKLRVTWTPETAEGVQMYGIDFEAKLASILAIANDNAILTEGIINA